MYWCDFRIYVCVLTIACMYLQFFVFFFFFKQKTAYEMRISDWSSDVCSSDLARANPCTSPRTGGVQLQDSASCPPARARDKSVVHRHFRAVARHDPDRASH